MLVLAAQAIRELKRSGSFHTMNPILQVPEELALLFTERVLARLPQEYYSTVSVDSEPHKGIFKLLKPIPKHALLEALWAAKIIYAKQEEEGV